jgi:hypothetical protein
MRRRYTRRFKKPNTRKGGINTSRKNNNNTTPRPTVKHPNSLPKFGPPGVQNMRKRLQFLKPEISINTPRYSFFQATKKNLGFK